MEDAEFRYRGTYLGIAERDGWEFATRVNASAVAVLVALTDESEVIFVEQHRKPVRARVIELPAGLVGDQDDPDEPLETAARRELFEETGYEASRLEAILECPSSAGMSDEIITFLFADGLEKTGAGGGDDSEDITVHAVPLEEASEWLGERRREGCMLDPKIYAALLWLERRRRGQVPRP